MAQNQPITLQDLRAFAAKVTKDTSDKVIEYLKEKEKSSEDAAKEQFAGKVGDRLKKKGIEVWVRLFPKVWDSNDLKRELEDLVDAEVDEERVSPMTMVFSKWFRGITYNFSRSSNSKFCRALDQMKEAVTLADVLDGREDRRIRQDVVSFLGGYGQITQEAKRILEGNFGEFRKVYLCRLCLKDWTMKKAMKMDIDRVVQGAQNIVRRQQAADEAREHEGDEEDGQEAAEAGGQGAAGGDDDETQPPSERRRSQRSGRR